MNSYEENLKRLYDLEKMGIKLGLSSTENLLRRLGNPHLGLKCVHLAGTNGKGSVGAMVETSLRNAGYKTGMYVSPHLVRFTERFKIAGKEIPEEKVLEISEKVWQAVDKREPPTFFEFTTAMAFLYFAEEKADIVILETGMGGRLDATNICEPMVTVITNIGLEHQEYLGKTLSAIAGEKAGIIKAHVPLVHGVTQAPARKTVEKKAEELGAKVIRRGRDITFRRNSNGTFSLKGEIFDLKNVKTHLVGKHQPLNACLALGVLEQLALKGYSVSQTDFEQGLQMVRWQGRLDKIQDEPLKPTIWLDGAHNVPAAKALVASLGIIKENKSRLVMVLGVMADKDLSTILGLLTPNADKVVFSRPKYKRAADPEKLLEHAPYSPDYETESDLKKAIERACELAGPDGAVLITGSLFTVGEALDTMGWSKKKTIP